MSNNDVIINIIANAKNAIQNIQKVSQSLQKTDVRVQSLRKSMALVMKNPFVTGTLAYAGTRVAKGALQAAAGFEKLQTSMNMLLGSERLGEKLYEDIRIFAAKTPLELEAVAGSVRNLLANAGESSESVIETVRRLGDLALGQGDVLNNLVRAYGQVKSLGKAMTQDLYQFANAGIPIFKALGGVLGVSQAKVRDLVSAGKVGFEDVRAALEALTNEGGKFYGQLDAQAELLGGKWSTAMSNVKEAQAALVESYKGEIMFVIDGIARTAAALNNADVGARKVVASLVGIGAAIPAVAVGAHALTFILGGLKVAMSAMLFNPLGLLITGAGVAALAVAKVAKAAKDAREEMRALKDAQRGGWGSLNASDKGMLRANHENLKKQEQALKKQVASFEKLKSLAKNNPMAPYDAVAHQDVLKRLDEVKQRARDIGAVMRESAELARSRALNAMGAKKGAPTKEAETNAEAIAHEQRLLAKLAGTQRMLQAGYITEVDALKQRINARAGYIESLNKEGIAAHNNIAVIQQLKAELSDTQALQAAREEWKIIDAQLFKPRGVEGQKAALTAQKNIYLQAGIDRVSVEKWAQNEISKVENNAYSKRLRAGMKYAQQAMSMLQQTFSMTQGLVTEIMKTDDLQHQQRIANLDKELERTQSDKEIALANARFYGENEALVLEDFAERERVIKEEKERAELAHKRKAFEAEKGMRIAQVSMGMAQGIVNAWVAGAATQPLPLGMALAGVMTTIIASLGAAQIGIIAAQKFPGLYMGGIVPPQGPAGGLYRLGDKNTAEAVIPLDALPRYAPALQQQEQGAPQQVIQYVFNIDTFFGNDEEAAQKIKELMQRAERVGGA